MSLVQEGKLHKYVDYDNEDIVFSYIVDFYDKVYYIYHHILVTFAGHMELSKIDWKKINCKNKEQNVFIRSSIFWGPNHIIYYEKQNTFTSVIIILK